MCSYTKANRWQHTPLRQRQTISVSERKDSSCCSRMCLDVGVETVMWFHSAPPRLLCNPHSSHVLTIDLNTVISANYPKKQACDRQSDEGGFCRGIYRQVRPWVLMAARRISRGAEPEPPCSSTPRHCLKSLSRSDAAVRSFLFSQTMTMVFSLFCVLWLRID